MGKRVAHRSWKPSPSNCCYEIDEPLPSPHYYTKVNHQAILENNELPLEEKFCLLSGIEWYKVLAAEKYIYCHQNVLKWDDSGAKDSLMDAHDRFLSIINSLPCEQHPLPDPDMYIDNIDWNAEIDPRLISEMDKEYFNPDEAENSTDDKISSFNSMKKSIVDKPRESYRLEDDVDIKDLAPNRNKCGDLLELKNAMNSSEQRSLNGDVASKDKKCESFVNEPFDGEKMLNDAKESTKYDSDCVKSWNIGALSSQLVNEKSCGDVLKDPGGQNCWNFKSNEWSNACDMICPGETLDCTQLTTCGNNSWNPKRSTNQNKDIKKIDSRTHSRVCRKREECQENTRSRKSQKHEGANSKSRQFEEVRPQRRYNLRSSKY